MGGNWKCNGTHASVENLVHDLNRGSVPSDIDVVVAPPFIFLDWVRANVSGSYQVAAQNCWVKSDGAFTGEISSEMLVDAGVPWVITGHSERRSLCGESNAFVGEKTGHALDVGLQVCRRRRHDNILLLPPACAYLTHPAPCSECLHAGRTLCWACTVLLRCCTRWLLFLLLSLLFMPLCSPPMTDCATCCAGHLGAGDCLHRRDA